MASEIERKFLVNEDELASYGSLIPESYISQGYLLDINNHILRVRVAHGDSSYLTYKGPNKGISRTEIEFRIPQIIGKLLLKVCNKVLDKTRQYIPALEYVNNCSKLVWEVDTFHNLDLPLTIAEIELPSEDTEFIKPTWLRDEVSHDSQYFNSNLIKRIKK